MENIRRTEQISAREIESKVRELNAKKELVFKAGLFSSDQDDEFKVVLASGEEVGIFKTWAVPAIPMLESEKGSGLNWDEVEAWRQKLSSNPTLCWETLEKWRSRTEIDDRRLCIIFNEREIPKSKDRRIGELAARLKLAFGCASAFYHIEAMVGDGNFTPGNPFAENLDNDLGGGFLDMAGMLLPSALGDMVKAEKLNWNSLNWKKIRNQLDQNIDVNRMAILMRVARVAGLKTEEVLFAANALEWIPVSVGGKKGDLPEDLAIQELLSSNIRKEKLTLGTVARDMNGLVRFMNWTPLVKDEVNFSQSAWWKYAAVCETSNQIIEELSDGSMIVPEHRQEFLEVVLPQLKNLDASSARGRFALWMLENNWIDQKVLAQVDRQENQMVGEVAKRMVELANGDEVLRLGDSNNRFLVGGKAAGLNEAAEIFGREFVGDVAIVTNECVSKWLSEHENLSKKIKFLIKEDDISKKLILAAKIRDDLSVLKFPDSVVKKVTEKVGNKMLAVRSSSFDEDTLVNGTAAGIYESEIGVSSDMLDVKIVEVISSFFSEKAVSYRYLHGLSDDPAFAVMVQEFVPGFGGAVFSSGNQNDWSVFVGETPGHIVGGDKGFDSLVFEGGRIKQDIKFGWLDPNTMARVGEMAILSESVLGGKTDMEFVVGENGIRVLQLRMLNSAEERGVKEKKPAERWYELQSGVDISNVVFSESSVGLVLSKEVNIDQFQGELFRCLVKNKNRISELSLPHRIPQTSHFANICLNLGIKLSFRNE